MASHKENYPCLSRSNALMLYNPNTKFEYRDTGHTLEGYNMRNGTRLYLFYSWTAKWNADIYKQSSFLGGEGWGESDVVKTEGYKMRNGTRLYLFTRENN